MTRDVAVAVRRTTMPMVSVGTTVAQAHGAPRRVRAAVETLAIRVRINPTDACVGILRTAVGTVWGAELQQPGTEQQWELGPVDLDGSVGSVGHD